MVSITDAMSAVAFLIVLCGCYRLSQTGKRRANMPPGPPTLPILGNAHQIPIRGFYKQYLLMERRIILTF